MGRDPPVISQAWSPGRMDVAEIFDGSDGESVSVSNAAVAQGNVVDGGHIALGLSTGASTSVNLNSTNSNSFRRGVTFNPNNDLRGIYATVGTHPSPTEVVSVHRRSDDALMGESRTTPASGEQVGIYCPAGLSAGTEYYVHVRTDGIEYNTSASTPFTGTDLDVTGGWDGSKLSGYAYTFTSVTGAYQVDTGSATISWPMPDDLAGWDIVPHAPTPEGGTVELYAEDSNGNELTGPLRDPGDISSLSRSTNVQIRVDLSRPSASEDPRLEAVYRRYKV